MHGIAQVTMNLQSIPQPCHVLLLLSLSLDVQMLTDQILHSLSLIHISQRPVHLPILLASYCQALPLHSQSTLGPGGP